MMTVRLFGLGLGRLEPHKYADSRNEIPGVDRPRLTMMWTSTPEKFLAATCQEDSESGQLNRFLSFKEEGLARFARQRRSRHPENTSTGHR